MAGDKSAHRDVPIRRASTVMLLRDGPRGVEVFTLQRVSSMVFASGMTVFPGGGVDPGDSGQEPPWRGPGADWWSQQWQIPVDEARSQVVAAVRELFEETGVLLADRPPDAAVARARADIADHRREFGALLWQFDLRLCADLLKPWSRWITPPGPPRRYDTYFFAAALPEGQRAEALTSEAESGGWQRPADVLDAWRSGSVGLMPPTISSLRDLAAAGSVAELMSTQRHVRPITPEVLSAEGEVLRVRADNHDYAIPLAFRPGRAAAADFAAGQDPEHLPAAPSPRGAHR